MHLATITNLEEHLAVLRIIDDNIDEEDNSTQAWIGYNDIDEEGNFVWVEDGQPGDWKVWWPGEPNNNHPTGNDEDCTEMSRYGTWNDQWCEESRPFVCERADD